MSRIVAAREFEWRIRCYTVPIRRRGVRLQFIRAIGRWTITVLGFSLIFLYAQEQKTEPLTVPAYHNLPTAEGYFQGAGGVRLFYRVAGRSGDPIVFLHGGPGLGLNDGGYDMEPLAEHGYRLLMFNERGAGRSEIITDRSKLRIEDFVQDVEEFRKSFGLEHFGLIGLSWGSGVALKYVARYPQRVTRVVFLSPMSPTIALYHARLKHLNALKTDQERTEEKEAWGEIRTAPDSQIVAVCEKLFGVTDRLYVVNVDHFKQSHENFCTLPASGLRNFPLVSANAGADLGEWDFHADIKNVHIPALVLEGAETNVPLDATREWAESLPNARLLLIPHAGHLNWVDQPEAVISAMDEFFKGNWPPGSK